MKLFELNLGQRFGFVGKHQGKEFEVVRKKFGVEVRYRDVATGEVRQALHNRVMFRKDVYLINPDVKTDTLSSIIEIVHQQYLDEDTEDGRRALNKLYLRLKGQ